MPSLSCQYHLHTYSIPSKQVDQPEFLTYSYINLVIHLDWSIPLWKNSSFPLEITITAMKMSSSTILFLGKPLINSSPTDNGEER